MKSAILQGTKWSKTLLKHFYFSNPLQTLHHYSPSPGVLTHQTALKNNARTIPHRHLYPIKRPWLPHHPYSPLLWSKSLGQINEEVVVGVDTLVADGNCCLTWWRQEPLLRQAAVVYSWSPWERVEPWGGKLRFYQHIVWNIYSFHQITNEFSLTLTLLDFYWNFGCFVRSFPVDGRMEQGPAWHWQTWTLNWSGEASVSSFLKGWLGCCCEKIDDKVNYPSKPA